MHKEKTLQKLYNFYRVSLFRDIVCLFCGGKMRHFLWYIVQLEEAACTQ